MCSSLDDMYLHQYSLHIIVNNILHEKALEKLRIQFFMPKKQITRKNLVILSQCKKIVILFIKGEKRRFSEIILDFRPPL